MIEQVKEVRAEAQILPFPQLECFAQRQIHILLWRPDNAVAGRVAIDRRIAGGSVGKRRQRVGLISQGIHPIRETRFRATVAGRVGTIETRSKGCGR